MIRYGMWLFLGLGTGLLQAALISYAVARLAPAPASRVRSRAILGSLMRFAITLLVLVAAIHDSVVACALAGVGLLMGRWLLVACVVMRTRAELRW